MMIQNRFDNVEQVLSSQGFFTAIVLLQGLFGSFGLVQIPRRLERVFQTPTFRVLALFFIAFTATNEIEYAAAGVVTFLLVMHLLRTEEERRENGYF